MSRPAIRVEGLGKMYRIGGPVERYRTFRDTVTQGVARFGRRVKGLFGGDGNGAAPKYETIWALKDVSFEIQPGEVVGVIGRNGAGKSTLLKILSRITEPTEGRVEIRGRVGSLLEVGTGFHPELTGRENVYLNGAILGMKRAEVDKKFDEIVAFAEIEKFIDTPVKHYSSGMYVRLAFSVAAHLDTDILLVDEVLSVGDVRFQQKCLGRMQERAFAEKTILFVTHNLAALAQFCPATILLSQGKMVGFADTGTIMPLYLGDAEPSASRDLRQAPRLNTGASSWNCLRSVSLWKNGQSTCSFQYGDDMEVRVECEFPEALDGVTASLGIAVTDPVMRIVLGMGTREQGKSPKVRNGRWVFRCRMPGLPLMPGRYSLNLYLGDGNREFEVIEQAIAFDVTWRAVEGVMRPPVAGCVFVPFQWQVEADKDLQPGVQECDCRPT